MKSKEECWYLWGCLVDSTRGSRLHGRTKSSRDVYYWGDMPCRNFVVDLSRRWVLLSLTMEVLGAALWLVFDSREEFHEHGDPKAGSGGRNLHPYYPARRSLPSIEILSWPGACKILRSEETLLILCVAEEGVTLPSEANESRAFAERGFSAALVLVTMDLRERRLAQCYQCETDYPFFKLFRSTRQAHVDWAKKMWGEKEIQVLLCISCEKMERDQEVRRWKQAGIDFHDDYNTEARIKREIKYTSKGDQWFKQCKVMKEAKDAVIMGRGKAQVRLNQMVTTPGAFRDTDVTEEEVQEFVKKGAGKVGLTLRNKIQEGLIKKARLEYDPETSVLEVTTMMRDASLTRKFFMSSMNPLMKNLVSNMITMLLQNAEEMRKQNKEEHAMITIFKDTGKDMVKVADMTKTYEADLDAGKDVDEAQEKLMEAVDWDIVDGETREKQVEYAKAADYEDELCPGMHVFNVCTCMDQWKEKKCGYAFPNKFWLRGAYNGKPAQVSEMDGQTVGRKGGWKCRCEWANVEEAAKELGPNSRAAQWWNELKEVFAGIDRADWPIVGCGQVFKAFSGGASLVIEMETTQKDGSKQWEAFNSERLPWLLENALKKNTVRKCFELASCKLEPAEVMKMLPVRFPMNHIALGHHPVTKKEMRFSGVAQYPLSEWEKAGRPMMRQRDWCELVMRISQFDLTELRPLYDVAKVTMTEPNVGKMPKWMIREWPEEWVAMTKE